MLGWWALALGCGAPSYSEQLDAYVATMKPAAESWKDVDAATLPDGEVAIDGREVLVVERGRPVFAAVYADGRDSLAPGLAASPEEVGVVVLSTVTRNPEPLYTYVDGSRGFTQRYRFAAVAVPERVVVARWTGAAVPPLQKYGSGTDDVSGYYSDYADDVRQLLAGEDPGRTASGDELARFQGSFEALLNEVGALDLATLPTAEPSSIAGRKLVVAQNGRPWEVFQGSELVATDAASVGAVLWLTRTPDELPTVTYDDGTPGYPSTYEGVVVAWPEKLAVARFTRRVEPPPSVMAAARERVDGLLRNDDLLALLRTLREGTAP